MPLVLVVEDDEDDQLLLSFVARQGSQPCELVFARDGESALDVLNSLKFSPDFIITDLNMPRMDGMELLREIKASPQWHAIPVVMLSTTENQQTIHTAYSSGISSFICKPPTIEELSVVWNQLYMLQIRPR